MQVDIFDGLPATQSFVLTVDPAENQGVTLAGLKDIVLGLEYEAAAARMTTRPSRLWRSGHEAATSLCDLPMQKWRRTGSVIVSYDP